MKEITEKIVRRILAKLRRVSSLIYWKRHSFPFIYNQGTSNRVFLGPGETLEYLLNSGQSLIRWGDGETALCLGADIPSQKYEPALRKELLNILSDSNIEDSFVLGIPHQFFPVDGFSYSTSKSEKIWADTFRLLKESTALNSLYGDAFIFRPLSPLQNADIVRLWNGKSVILISSSEANVSLLRRISWPNSITFIPCPIENSFTSVSNLLESIIRATHGVDRKLLRVLISAGAGGKVLARRLVCFGFVCYDLGHYFEWKAVGRSNNKGQ